MKNMIELPTEKDFHKTTLIEVSQERKNMYTAPKQDEYVMYRKCIINMRNIVDIIEYEIIADVLDESKSEEYKKQMDEFHKKGISAADIHFPISDEQPQIGGRTQSFGDIIPMPPMPPECPTKQFKLKCTLILYFNGIQRMIVDDFNEFSQEYFAYLQKQQLDLRN
jgi:hypothetical protein